MVTKVQKWQCIPKFDKTAYDFGQNVSKIPRVFPDHGLPELQLFSALTSHVIQGVSRHWTPRTELDGRIMVHHGAVLHIIMPSLRKNFLSLLRLLPAVERTPCCTIWRRPWWGSSRAAGWCRCPPGPCPPHTPPNILHRTGVQEDRSTGRQGQGCQQRI